VSPGREEPIPVMRPLLGAEEAQAAADAVTSGWVAQGPRVKAFEAAFAGVVESREAVAVSSCTAGLHLALIALGVGPGDEVIVPSLSFIATANAVRYVGAVPIFVDVDAQTLNISRATVEPAISPSTKVVMVVHQGGTPADLDPLRALCDERDIALLEDAACAIGTTYKGRPVGAGSGLAAFSFHPRKVITTGEGGMITTMSDSHAGRLRRLREHGMNVSASERHHQSSVVVESYLEVGFNYRMTDIQAAVGLVQLARLGDIVARRRQLAAAYQERLSGIEGIRFAADPPWGESNFQSMWVELPAESRVSRNAVLEYLLAEGISARRGIMAAHLEPPYAGCTVSLPVPLPVTERMTERSVILPLFHELTHAQVDRITEVFGRAVRS